MQLSATHQFIRAACSGGGAGPSVLATWNMTNAPPGGERFDASAGASRGVDLQAVQLIREGLDYGDQNLHQLDLRASKRVHGQPVSLPARLRPLQRLEQQLAVHGVSTTYLELWRLASTWLRPTRALDGRMFKIGGSSTPVDRPGGRAANGPGALRTLSSV